MHELFFQQYFIQVADGIAPRAPVVYNTRESLHHTMIIDVGSEPIHSQETDGRRLLVFSSGMVTKVDASGANE